MVYTPPTLAGLRAAISRDLHDDDNGVFTSPEVTDMINSGLAELNRLIPKEYREVIPLIAGQYDYDLPTDSTAGPVQRVFSVEVWANDANDITQFQRDVPRRDEEARSGYEFWGGVLMLPHFLSWNVADTPVVVVMGYQDRVAVSDDADILDVDLDGEQVIRSYCAFTGFQRLIQSRALFQQWQTQTNNADVSATQLLGMAANYSREWRDMRMRVRRLRRSG